jgi:hypothetical protein
VAVADSACLFSKWFEETCADVVIVRPDRVVYGAYTAAEIEAALINLAGVLCNDPAAVTAQQQSRNMAVFAPCDKLRPSYWLQRSEVFASALVISVMLLFALWTSYHAMRASYE